MLPCPRPSDSSAYSISTLKFADAAAGLSGSSHALRTRTLSTGSWPIFARRNREPLPGTSWHRQPGRHLPTGLFSQEANPQTQTCKDDTEKHVAQTVAYYYSGMSGYEWHAQHSEQGFGINERELLQISNPSRQNQRECLLSTGPLYFLYFGLIYITLVCFLLD